MSYNVKKFTHYEGEVTMQDQQSSYLSKRERQIMDILYQLGKASVSDIVQRMAPDTSYDSVRITLGILA